MKLFRCWVSGVKRKRGFGVPTQCPNNNPAILIQAINQAARYYVEQSCHGLVALVMTQFVWTVVSEPVGERLCIGCVERCGTLLVCWPAQQKI